MIEKIKNSIQKSTEYEKFCSVLFNIFEWFYTKFCFGILSRFERKFVKFLFVGFLNTVFSYVVYATFVTFTGRASLSLLLSYILGILFNFQTTGRIVFQNKNNALILKFFLSYIITFFINKTCLEFLIEGLNINKYLSQAILVLPVAMISFILLKNFVFKEKRTDEKHI